MRPYLRISIGIKVIYLKIKFLHYCENVGMDISTWVPFG
ncbi:hypothetical protein CHRY9293_00506 [Chryseobacterium potabilaquae]|uniref:Uncharacterized protein n=1 Tax=Chryseobacterium potabilaquae TaxID=2675057 RepID=A0A6N4X065_9FLAO|nr:hypothetical protein CHRY9293_00506 [Chryseobacterium potabilaquae]